MPVKNKLFLKTQQFSLWPSPKRETEGDRTEDFLVVLFFFSFKRSNGLNGVTWTASIPLFTPKGVDVFVMFQLIAGNLHVFSSSKKHSRDTCRLPMGQLKGRLKVEWLTTNIDPGEIVFFSSNWYWVPASPAVKICHTSLSKWVLGFELERWLRNCQQIIFFAKNWWCFVGNYKNNHIPRTITCFRPQQPVSIINF